MHKLSTWTWVFSVPCLLFTAMDIFTHRCFHSQKIKLKKFWQHWHSQPMVQGVKVTQVEVICAKGQSSAKARLEKQNGSKVRGRALLLLLLYCEKGNSVLIDKRNDCCLQERDCWQESSGVECHVHMKRNKISSQWMHSPFICIFCSGAG